MGNHRCVISRRWLARKVWSVSLWFPADINVTAASDETKDLELTKQWHANQRYIISTLMLPCDLSNVLLCTNERRDPTAAEARPRRTVTAVHWWIGRNGNVQFELQVLRGLWIWKEMLMFFFLLSVFPYLLPRWRRWPTLLASQQVKWHLFWNIHDELGMEKSTFLVFAFEELH